MPPMPKDPSTRQRRNKAATRTTLHAVHDVEAPALPKGRRWRKATKDWWADVWASPMAPEYDSSDVHGLFVLAALVDEFWAAPSTALASEIRLQRQAYGLSPIDRRRLEWSIDRGDEAVERTRERQAARTPKPAEDPRNSLAS